jgi:hypothetical protein
VTTLPPVEYHKVLHTTTLVVKVLGLMQHSIYAIPMSEHILRWKAILAWIEGEMTLFKVKHN